MDQKAIEAAGYDKGLEDGKKQGIEAGVELGKKQGIEAGVELGKKQGIEIGVEQGISAAKIEIAREMKLQGYDHNAIKKLTGLSIEEIENL